MNAKPKRVAILITSPPQGLQLLYEAPFVDRMSELGRREGCEIIYDRWYTTTHLISHGDRVDYALKRLEQAERPDVIWVVSTATALAALKAREQSKWSDVPIVGSALSSVIRDRVKPDNNLAGIINCGWELGPRRLEFLQSLMPHLRRVAVLVDDGNSIEEQSLINQSSTEEFKRIAEQAKNMRLEDPLPVRVQRGQDIQGELGNLDREKVDALMTTHIPHFQNKRDEILCFTRRVRLPLVGHRTFFVEDGALMAYSSVLRDQMRRSADITDDVLNGIGTPRVEGPKTFELAINLKSPGAESICLPKSICDGADQQLVLLHFSRAECPE